MRRTTISGRGQPVRPWNASGTGGGDGSRLPARGGKTDGVGEGRKRGAAPGGAAAAPISVCMYWRCTLIHVPAHVPVRRGGPAGPSGAHRGAASASSGRSQPAAMSQPLPPAASPAANCLLGAPAGADSGAPTPPTAPHPLGGASFRRPLRPGRPPAPPTGGTPAWPPRRLPCPSPPDGPWRWRVAGRRLAGLRTAADAGMAANADSRPLAGMGVAAGEEVGEGGVGVGATHVDGGYLGGGPCCQPAPRGPGETAPAAMRRM